MPQQYKLDQAAHLKEVFDDHTDFIFTDYRGLNVGKITDLRNELRKLDTKYLVVKNNYVKIIIKENNYPDFGEHLKGPTAIAFTKSDVNEIAKILFKFKKDTPLVIKGGYVSGSVLSDEQVETISKLPGKEQMIAMFMSTLNAPLQNFVFACNDIPGRLVRVLNAVKEQKEKAS